MIDVAALVDRAAGERVVVFGSPPPHGRDLDLLVRRDAERAIAASLGEAGFVRRGVEWVRFSDCTARAVDLLPASDWALPDEELDALFARAVPIEGFTFLVEPAPADQLLILATRVWSGGVLSPRRRARVERALTADPAAFEHARERAHLWGEPGALDALRAVVESAQKATLFDTARRNAGRLARRRVITLSGIDGSGKSTHARALEETLGQLGYDAGIVWTPLAQNRWLDKIARPIKRLLGRFASLRPAPTPQHDGPRGIVPNPGRELRNRNPAVNAAWATLVAFGNGVAHARLGLTHLRAGRVVIYDRYILDSVVRMRFFYGEQRSFRLQRALIRLLSPKPLVSFFLDVSVEESLARKDDAWAPDELAAQARLYREEYADAGAVRLDGGRSREELCAEIAETVWRRLDG